MRPAILIPLVVLCFVPGFASPADEPAGSRPLFHFTPPKNFINDPTGSSTKRRVSPVLPAQPRGRPLGPHELGPRPSRDLMHWQSLAHRAPRARRHHDLLRKRRLRLAEHVGSRARPMLRPLSRSTPATATRSRRKISPRASITVAPGRSSRAIRCSTSTQTRSATRRFSGTSHNRWIMATVLADDRKVRLWGSKDLKTWEKLSDFGPAGSTKGVWECPELFEAPGRRRSRGESRWVLKVDVNDGAPFGGSGGQYFVGRFDGKEFRREATRPDPLWIDFGKDFYASQTWNDAPAPPRLARLDEQLAICQRDPDLTLARRHDNPSYPLRSAKPTTASASRNPPSRTLKTIRREHQTIDARAIPVGETKLDDQGIAGIALEIIAEFEPGDSPTSSA